MHPTPWFERRFEFSFPPDYLPNILARLRGTPARLAELLQSAPALLRQRPDGKWAAQEHAGHLEDMESLWLARVEDYAAAREALTPADLQNRRTHEANHNLRQPEDILRGFSLARGTLLRRVAELDRSSIIRTLPHPRMQTPMRLIDHLFFVAEHDDHHLAGIHGLLGLID